MNLADCYRLLGLRSGASFSDIKASYRRLARIYHPDVNPHNQDQAREKFIQVTDAYQTLISLVRRPSLPEVAPTPAQPSAPPFSQPSWQRPPDASPPPARGDDRRRVHPPPHTAARSRPADVRSHSRLSLAEQKLKQASYTQLQRLLKEQRFPRAIALVEGLSQRIPNDPEVRQWQAIAYERWGRHLINCREFNKARSYLRKALRTDPNNRALWVEIERDFHRMEQILQVSSR